MSSTPRQTKSGKWELTVFHKALPKGRKFFTFGTREAAQAYSDQWSLLVNAGLPLPVELAQAAPVVDGTLGQVLRARANTDGVASSDQPVLALLLDEIGSVRFSAVDYAWVENWVRDLKVRRNLAPSSVRKRVGTLSRAIDDYLRKMKNIALSNPLKMLPRGYSFYTERDTALTRAAGHEAKFDIERDRRLHGDEEARIVAALRGEKRQDRERPLGLPDGEALLLLFMLLVFTGTRLKEAYTLRVDRIDLEAKMIRATKSKLRLGKVAFKDVPIQPALFPLLKAHAQARAEATYLLPFWDGAERHEKVSRRLSAAMAKAFQYAQIEDLTAHDLRHEATCRWLELRDRSGNWMFRIEEVNRMMGWAPNSKMAQRYASFRGETLAARMWA